MELTDTERNRYEWQMNSPVCGESGQARLRNSSILISRVGGVGGSAAMALAAAGVGRLVLAHAGSLRLNDLNRQLLMKTAAVGTSRVNCAAERLREINPHVEIEVCDENVSVSNAERLISSVDLVIDAAPLFDERFAINDAAVKLRRPIIECAMYDFTARVTTVIPGRSACLRCLCPENPEHWKRQFPVFAAVSSMTGAIAATEALKLLLGQETLAGQLLIIDALTMDFRRLPISRRPDCAVCGHLT